jgi:hypothetical protein
MDSDLYVELYVSKIIKTFVIGSVRYIYMFHICVDIEDVFPQ